jgi:hypothetical protein
MYVYSLQIKWDYIYKKKKKLTSDQPLYNCYIRRDREEKPVNMVFNISVRKLQIRGWLILSGSDDGL